MRNFMNYFIEQFIDEVSDFYGERNQGHLSQIDTIRLYEPLIIAVLYPNNMEYMDFDCVRYNIPNTIIIPKSFYEYIIPTVNKVSEYIEDDGDGDYYDIDRQILLKALSGMLFIKY